MPNRCASWHSQTTRKKLKTGIPDATWDISVRRFVFLNSKEDEYSSRRHASGETKDD